MSVAIAPCAWEEDIMMRGVNTRSGLMERHMAGGCRCGKIEDEDEEDEEERNGESGRRRGEKMQHTKQHNQPHTVTSDQHRLEKTTFPQMQLQEDILNSAQDDWCRRKIGRRRKGPRTSKHKSVVRTVMTRADKVKMSTSTNKRKTDQTS